MTNADQVAAISAEVFRLEQGLADLQSRGAERSVLMAAGDALARMKNRLIHAQGALRNEEYAKTKAAEEAAAKARRERLNQEARERGRENITKARQAYEQRMAEEAAYKQQRQREREEYEEAWRRRMREDAYAQRASGSATSGPAQQPPAAAFTAVQQPMKPSAWNANKERQRARTWQYAQYHDSYQKRADKGGSLIRELLRNRQPPAPNPFQPPSPDDTGDAFSPFLPS